MGWASETDSQFSGFLDATTVDTVIVFGCFWQIISKEMVNALLYTPLVVGKECFGFVKDDIEPHLLHSGMAISMYLGKCPVHTIMLIRQWSSNAFLLYIRKQAKQFSHNVANKMFAHEIYDHIPDYKLTISWLSHHLHKHADNAATHWNVGRNIAAQSWLPAFALHYWKTRYIDGGVFWFLLEFGHGGPSLGTAVDASPLFTCNSSTNLLQLV